MNLNEYNVSYSKNNECITKKKNMKNESDIDKIFTIEIKDILKNSTNEKEINDTIEFVTDKINTLNNFINKIAKEKYEYFYKYTDEICNLKEKIEWNSCELENIQEKYNINNEALKENKDKLLSLIKEKKCLIDIDKILKLYIIINEELKKLSYEIKDNKNFEIFNFLKEEDMGCNGCFEMINIDNINSCIDNVNSCIDNVNSCIDNVNSCIDNINSCIDDIDFEVFMKYIKRLNNLKRFVVYNNVQNISIIKLKIKKINYYENYITDIFVKYLSKNFYKDENYVSKVKFCLNAFSYLNVEKECLKKIVNNKINKISLYISNIKKNKNIKENFFFIIENCKNNIFQIYYINETIKNNYVNNIIKTANIEEEIYDYNSSCTNEQPIDKCYTINIYNDFYLPYINILIKNKINEYIKKENILYVLNLIEEFLHITRNKNEFKFQEKDLLLSLFSKEYEEITFNSINKLANLVELLFEKKKLSDNVGFEYDYNFPTIFDIKNYVIELYKELYTHIFYPYLFRKIIVSCNNSLLLLSNNLNNLKQNINFHVELDTKKKYINCEYIYKNFKYNLELYLVGRKILKYLILNLEKLKRKILEIKRYTYKKRNVDLLNGNCDLTNLLQKKENNENIPNYIDNNLISFSFSESFDEFFNFQDYLNNYFFNVINMRDDEQEDFTETENYREKKKTEVKRLIEKEDEKIMDDLENRKDKQEPHQFEEEKQETDEDEKKKLNNFEINYITDVKYNSFNSNECYYLSDEEKEENYEINSFFIKEKKKKKKNFFDLLELEKGIYELNNVVNSCIYECFECFEKKSLWYFKDNCNVLNTDEVYSLFDQLCIYFNNNVVKRIPLSEIQQMITNLINKIVIYIVSLSSFYLINNMDIYIFKYYESLLKITNNEMLSSLNFEQKLCNLFKKSIDIKNRKEEYKKIPSFFLPITFIILHGGKSIVNYLNITEEKFINLIIDYLKDPLQLMNKKSNTNQNLNFVLNRFAKNMVVKDNFIKT
ncbi:conserved Plasmodium protein, unknown function [Plasmodium gallinaceum]|uniref:Uncharacterized protein n=1 Tax=Plasmodium gallinaceum TaxID=5849 RepID=A0A1J1GNT8_PLAGA|nr:conserved Plasmodium protein, unknown function [Plasmodium gallinaceum]CRG93988.1 conserved Plasmodium protein, unknown function [Plasmodium gallinaceum]